MQRGGTWLKFAAGPQKKRYYGKSCYEYEGFFIEIQKRFHDRVKPFLDKDLEMNVVDRGRRLVIELSLPRPPAKSP